MKTRATKCGIFAALAAVLLITAALVTSCVEPVGPGGLTVSQGGRNSAPPGMGYIQLNIQNDKSGARTVLPTTGPTILEYLVIARVGSASPAASQRIAAAAISTTPVTVPTGTYNVEVQGFTTVGGTTVATLGSTSGVVVTSSTAGSASVTQHEVIDGTGTGTFAWNFTFPIGSDTVGSATMTVSSWGSEGNAIPSTLVNATLNTASASGSETLPSGNYYVDVTLAKTDHRSQTYREIVRVYNTLTSTWTKSNFHSLSSNVYTVTYVDSDGNGAATVNNVAHGDLLTEPTTPTYTGNTFGGWFRDDSAFLKPWTFATDKVLGDLSLYAKWTPTATGSINVTVSYSFGVTGQTFTLTPNPLPPFSLDDIYDGGGSITVTLDNTGTIFNAASVKWTYSGDTEIEWTGLTLEIDFDDPKYMELAGAGFYDIAVEAVRASDSLVYTSSLTLEITP